MSRTAYRCPFCRAGIVITVDSRPAVVTCPRCNRESPLASLEEIQPRKIVCPSCRVILSVDPLIKGVIACPQCRNKNDISIFNDYRKVVAPPEDANKTVLPDSVRKISGTGTLNLIEGECLPRKIILKPGINLIGRKSTAASVPIELDTTDSCISRKHLAIEVTLKPNGSVEHGLSDAGSSNGTFHNGERIDSDDIILLTPGDKIKIGNTTFLFTLD